MRHGKKVNHLSRKTAHRRAMLANMACSLIEHKRINTTVAKAKALKQFIEPLITKSKAENNLSGEKGTHNRRIVFRNLRDKNAVTELFSAVSEKVADRPGGYTRIIKLGNRLGDNADMAMIELVDFNEVYNAGKPKKQKSTRRSRKGKSAGASGDAQKAPATQKQAAPEKEAAPEKAAAPKKQEIAEEVATPEKQEVAEEVATPEKQEVAEEMETPEKAEAPEKAAEADSTPAAEKAEETENLSPDDATSEDAPAGTAEQPGETGDDTGGEKDKDTKE